VRLVVEGSWFVVCAPRRTLGTTAVLLVAAQSLVDLGHKGMKIAHPD
jgi:hypothetical protein